MGRSNGVTGTPKRKSEPIKAWLIRSCSAIRRHVEIRGLATPEEIAEVWPKNTRQHVIKWARVYGYCRVWVARQDSNPSRVDRAEEQMLDALNEEPRQIRLPVKGTSVSVYPKSLRTLLWFRAHDWMVEWIATRTMAIREAADSGELTEDQLAEPLVILERCEIEIAAQLSAMAAVACHKGPGIPIEAEYDAEPSKSWPGEDWTEIDPVDLYAIHAAYSEVNAGRMEALERICKPHSQGATSERMSWNVFLGTLAMKLHKDPTELATDYSLVKLLSTVRLGRPDVDELGG